MFLRERIKYNFCWKFKKRILITLFVLGKYPKYMYVKKKDK